MARRTLAVEPRTILGKKVKQLRRDGVTPANIFGPGVPSQPVQTSTHDLALLLRNLDEGDTVQIEMDGKMRQVVIQEVQWNAVANLPRHVDFLVAGK